MGKIKRTIIVLLVLLSFCSFGQNMIDITPNFAASRSYLKARNNIYVLQRKGITMLKVNNDEAKLVTLKNAVTKGALLGMADDSTLITVSSGYWRNRETQDDTIYKYVFTSDSTLKLKESVKQVKEIYTRYWFAQTKIFFQERFSTYLKYIDYTTLKTDSIEFMDLAGIFQYKDKLLITKYDSLILFNSDLTVNLKKSVFGHYINSIYTDATGTYLSTSSGLYFSNDDFQTIIPQTNGIKANTIVYGIVNHEGIYYAGTDSAFYKLEDGKWNPFYTGTQRSTSFLLSHKNTLFVGGEEAINYSGNGIKWSNLFVDSEGYYKDIHDLQYENGILVGVGFNNIIISDDKGKTWSRMMSPLFGMDGSFSYNFEKSLISSDKIFIGSTFGEIFYTPISDKFNWKYLTKTPVNQLSELTIIDDKILVGGSSGLYYSSDTVNWVQIMSESVNKVIKLSSGKYLCAAVSGLYLSNTLTADTWTKVFDTNIYDIKESGQYIYCLTDAYSALGSLYPGIIRSSDGGYTWENYNSNIPEAERSFVGIEVAKDYLVSSAYSGIFITKESSGVWRKLYGIYPSSECLFVEDSIIIASDYKIYKAVVEDLFISTDLNDEVHKEIIVFYPNPVHDVLTIKADAFVYCSITTTTGSVVLESDKNTIDLSLLNSGLYFVTVQTKSGEKVTSKVIKY